MSPIKNLSEEVRLPRLGKIKLGTKNPEKGYPMKADHFVFPKDHSDYEKLVKTFGAEPKELRVLIPVEDEEQWATQYYKAYNLTRGLVCKGDGDTAMRQIDVKTGDLPSKETLTTTMKEMPCAGRDCPDYKAKKCHEVMNFRFILPEIPGLGVWQIDTGSINSILNINSSAKIIKKAFGRISMIPLILSFKPAKAKNPQDGKQQTIYVLNLETNITLAQLADVAREQAKTLMLEAPDLGKEYDLETERLTEELFGEDEPVKAPPTPPPAEPKPIPLPSQEKGTGSEPTGKDKLYMNIRERRPGLKTDKNIADWLTGPLKIDIERLTSEPDAVWNEVRQLNNWS
jgi:hypothetical protein